VLVLVLEILASISVWRSGVRELDLAWLKSLLIGSALDRGARARHAAGAQGFRLLVLNLLIVISALSVARALFDLVAPN
jgi:hypothetical protein